MENSKCSSNFRNLPYSGKLSMLPPKCPLPSVSPSYADYNSSSALGAKGIPWSREGNRQHLRTSSESFLIEEQPSWVEELLDEPATPVRRGHRRASSDSFPYIDVTNISNAINILKEESNCKSVPSVPSRCSVDFDCYRDVQHASFCKEPNSFRKQQNGSWESSLSFTYLISHPYAGSNNILKSSGPSCNSQESDSMPSTTTRKQDKKEPGLRCQTVSVDGRDCSHSKPSASETDPKRAKQQFAQRSRVRKLQYIAELERNVQALQAEGSGVSAEIDFLNQQNLFLDIKNKALKQRLDSLAEEHVIKRMEQDLLEREVARLQSLYKQQQQQHKQQKLPTHRRATSWDLDLRFANLSMKHMENGAGHDSVNGSLHI